MDKRQNATTRILRERLSRDARAREASGSLFTASIATASFAFVVVLGRSLGPVLTHELLVLLGFYAAYFGIQTFALRRGWFHPSIQWLNAALEISGPAAMIALDVQTQGPVYALSSPPIVIWGGLVMLCALRMRPALALMAGALAAGEYLAVYVLLILPRLPVAPSLALAPPMIFIRVFLLFAFGPLTAVIAWHLLGKAEEALASVRAQELLGKYFLHERIGTGGMAEVFRATYCPEGGFERQVAVKRVLPAFCEDQEFLTLFRREAELCAKLTHHNIVQVLDFFRQANTLYLAMEYVDGLSLKALLRRAREPMPISAVMYLGAELANALDYLHRKTDAAGRPLNLVHRDLNPPNILVSRIGEVKLGDFGVAHSTGFTSITTAGHVRGKVGYMAPEQAMGKPFDGRADLFALGLTLHEVLTGERVLTGPSDIELMRASVFQPIPPPSVTRPDVPPEVDALVLALLARDPQARTSSASDARNQLLALPPSVAPYGVGQQALAAFVQQVLGSREDAISDKSRPPREVTPLDEERGHPQDLLTSPATSSTVRQRRPDRAR